MLEAAEVGEHFQWKNPEEINAYIKKNKDAIGQELADVLQYLFYLAYELHEILEKAFYQKLKKNEKRFPVKKIKGKHTNHYK